MKDYPTNLTDNIEVLAALATIGDHHVRVHVGREVGRARAGAAQHAVHEDALAIAGGLDGPFAGLFQLAKTCRYVLFLSFTVTFIVSLQLFR
jgi:hypothetical protein